MTSLSRWSDRKGRKDKHTWHAVANECSGGTRFMHRALEIQDEVPRMVFVLGNERRGRLPTVHVQCRCCSPEHRHVEDNHLACCLGVECRKCPYLNAIESTDMSDDHKDEAKAWTCAAHILDSPDADSSEGMLLTVDDRMFWDGVYSSLAGEGS